MTDSPFEELVKNLFKATKRVDTALAELQDIAAKINAKYEPRTQFIRWRSSQEGRLWKQGQYKAQGRCCAICKEGIRLKGSHIDHIKPLSLFPHLALDTRNLRVTCPDCNTFDRKAATLLKEESSVQKNNPTSQHKVGHTA